MIAKLQKNHLIVVVLVAVSIFSPLVMPSSTAQQGTQVGAILCHGEGPDVQISSPLSDSVTNNPSVSIIGTAVRTSQIDIVINGQYSHSVGIGLDSDLQTQVTLRPGTNTITLQAFFSCNNTSANFDLIVDYQPIVLPTNPTTTDSSIPQEYGGSRPTASGGNFASPSIIERINDNLSVSPSNGLRNSYVKVSFNWLIFIIILTLCGVLFSSSLIIEKIAKFIGISRYKRLRHPHRMVRFIIMLLITIFAFILAA